MASTRPPLHLFLKVHQVAVATIDAAIVIVVIVILIVIMGRQVVVANACKTGLS